MTEFVSDSQKLFIGGLRHNCQEQQLLQFLEKFGKVLSLEFKRKHKAPYECLGHGVMTVSRETAERFLRLEFLLYDKRKIQFKYYLEGKLLKKVNEKFNRRRLYIFDIPKSVNERQLRKFFERIGPIKNCYLKLDDKVPQSEVHQHHIGEGLVVFRYIRDAEKAQSGRYCLKGQKITIISQKHNKKKEQHLEQGKLRSKNHEGKLAGNSLIYNTEIHKSPVNQNYSYSNGDFGKFGLRGKNKLSSPSSNRPSCVWEEQRYGYELIQAKPHQLRSSAEFMKPPSVRYFTNLFQNPDYRSHIWDKNNIRLN